MAVAAAAMGLAIWASVPLTAAAMVAAVMVVAAVAAVAGVAEVEVEISKCLFLFIVLWMIYEGASVGTKHILEFFCISRGHQRVPSIHKSKFR